MIDKNIKDITFKDFASLKIYDDVDFEKQRDPEEIYNLIDRGNQVLKEIFINKELERINNNYRKVNSEFNLITTVYFKKEIENKLTIVASRTVEPGPEEITKKKKHWLFKGFITFNELQHFSKLYPIFEELYSEYSRDECNLELDIIGGIAQGQLLVDTDSIQDWRKEGVLLEPWGFNETGKMISFTELLVKANKEFKEKANRVRKKERIDSIDDMRILKLDDKGEKLFNSIFY